MYRCGIKLKSTTANAAALKLLRKHFPDRSLSELRGKIQAHEYLYLTDMEKSLITGERHLAKLLKEFDRAGLETELFEEYRDAPGPWKAQPMSRELLRNSVGTSREIERQTLEDIEREAEGFISPEAAALIEEETAERARQDREDEL